VGEKTARKLLRRFGSVARLKQLTVGELASELPRSSAEHIYAALRAADAPVANRPAPESQI
jgi:excinuclease UvrABC nuclease subunit